MVKFVRCLVFVGCISTAQQNAFDRKERNLDAFHAFCFPDSNLAYRKVKFGDDLLNLSKTNERQRALKETEEVVVRKEYWFI